MESAFKNEITGLQTHYRGNTCNYQQTPAAVFYLHNSEHIFYFTGERKPSSPVPGEQNQQEASRNSKPHINSFQRFFKSLGLKKHGGVGREDNAQCTGVWEILKLNLNLSSRNSKTNPDFAHSTQHHGYLASPATPYLSPQT